MKKIRVLQVIGSSDIGGGEKICCSIIKYLDKDKFEVSIACPEEGRMFNDFKESASGIRTFNFKNWINPLTILSLRKYMEEKAFDIIHTHLYSADFLGLISARLAGIPCAISTAHGYNFSHTGRFDLRSLKNFFFSFFYRIIYVFSDSVIAVSEAVKKDLVRRPGLKVKESKLRLIYNGIDLNEIIESNKAQVEEIKGIYDLNFKIIGVIANFDRIKGHSILLKAIPDVLKEIKNVKFIFVGDGEERERSEYMADRSDIRKNTFFLGARKDSINILKICDAIVLPSLLEGLPLVILEAMALGKPVIATKTGGVPELIKENENGILVMPNDCKGLANAIVKVLKDAKLTLSLGEKNRRMFYNESNGKFEAPYMAREIERLYMECLKNKVSGKP